MIATLQAVCETARERVFAALSDLKWHSWKELQIVGGVRYSARLLELRRSGFSIESRPETNSPGKRYRLLSTTPGEPTHRRVRVYMDESDAIDAVTSRRLRGRAWEAVKRALDGFHSSGRD